jgi:hypothetical protein
MNTTKNQYMQRIRHESYYPAFKDAVGIIAILFYFLGGFCALAGFIGMYYCVKLGFDEIGIAASILGLTVGGIFAGVGIIIRGASRIFTDIADSITDLNARYEQEGEEGNAVNYSSQKGLLSRTWMQLIILLILITAAVSIGWVLVKLF